MCRQSEADINEQLNRADNVTDRVGTLFRGMSYEQGVSDGIKWARGERDEKPLPDEEYAEYDDG
jgi:hypothetical protein